MAKLNPYICRTNDAREVLDFYATALGGKPVYMTFGDMPMPGMPEEQKSLIMHSQLETPNGLTLMASDGGSMQKVAPPTNGVTVALTGSTTELDYANKAYDVLKGGASNVMPFEKAPWGAHYGQLTDKYGVTWMFNFGDDK
jgi:PhnB protein